MLTFSFDTHCFLGETCNIFKEYKEYTFFLYMGYLLSLYYGVSISNSRVPDDSDAKSGVIRQRQNCLESRIVEGQDLPVLTLAPCTITKDVPAANQVQDSGII